MRKVWLLLSASVACAANLSAGWRTYRQTVALTFGSPDEAARAQLAALPLPPGKNVAFSTRWDDTNNDHARMVDVLSAHGYKGTFYLNQVDQAYADTAIRKMLEKGCSVGAHTVHHPHLPKLGPNALFKELLANRIALEAASGSCVVAFTLPYGDCTAPDDREMPRKIGDCLLRSGLLGSPERTLGIAATYGRTPEEWVGAHTFSINDRDPQLDLFEKAVKTGLQAIAGGGLACGPHLTLGIHTWQKTDAGFTRFGEIIATEANRPDWWYCNENEYVAYRLQMFHSAIAKKEVTDKTVTFTVDRAMPCELGGRVALGLRARPAPRKASAGGQPLPLSETGAFLLPHDAARQLPTRIAAVHNTGNRNEAEAALAGNALPGVRLGLRVSAEKNLLGCSLGNATGADFTDVHLTFRVPPKWKTGVVVKDVDVLKAGAERRFEIELGDRETDPAYETGDLFFAVQCDLTDTQGPARIHATTEVAQPSAPQKNAR